MRLRLVRIGSHWSVYSPECSMHMIALAYTAIYLLRFRQLRGRAGSRSTLHSSLSKLGRVGFPSTVPWVGSPATALEADFLLRGPCSPSAPYSLSLESSWATSRLRATPSSINNSGGARKCIQQALTPQLATPDLALQRSTEVPLIHFKPADANNQLGALADEFFSSPGHAVIGSLSCLRFTPSWIRSRHDSSCALVT